MFLRIILCTTLALAVNGQLVANMYFDHLLEQISMQPSFNGYEPTRINDFTCVMAFPTHNVTVETWDSWLWGVSNIKRKGDCTYVPNLYEINISRLRCLVSLHPIRAHLKAIVENDCTDQRRHPISMVSTIGENSYMSVEIKGPRLGFALFSQAELVVLEVSSILTEGLVYLEHDTWYNVVNLVNNGIKDNMKEFVDRAFLNALNPLLAAHPMP